MIDEADLLGAIAAAPDDEAARLVYADWLTQAGDPRGELIQLTLALEAMDDFDARRTATSKRINTVHREHGDTWLAPFRALALPGVQFAFDRGLVTGVRGSASALADAAPRILEHTPFISVVEIQVGDARELDPLAGSPLLAGARRLHLTHYTPVRPTGWQALVVPEVRAILLSSIAVGPADLAALFAAPNAPNLESLTISGCRLNRGALEPLAEASFALKTLDMPAHKQGPRLGELLGGNTAFHGLLDLRIPGNEIGSAGFAALLPALAHVERLDLRGCALTVADLRHLFRDGAISPTARQLRLGGQELDDDFALDLSRWRGAASLQVLDLGHAGITAAGARALADAPLLANLRSLNLSGARLDPATEAALLASPHLAAARIYAGNRFLSRNDKKRTSKRAPKRSSKAKPR